MKNFLKRIYLFLVKHVFGGHGLRRYKFLRELNFRLELFFKGERKEYIDRKGFRFFLDPREQLVSLSGGYEPETTAFVEKNLKEGGYFVDVGSAIGWFALIASRSVGPSGRVTAIEPNPVELEILRKNISYNSCKNIDVIEQAAGKEREKKTLYTFSDFLAASTFTDPRTSADREIHLRKEDDHSIHEYQVHVAPLDELVRGKADIIKIDVEKHELEVLRGMPRILREIKPILIVENPSAKARDLLRSAGYAEKFFLDTYNAVWVSAAMPATN